MSVYVDEFRYHGMLGVPRCFRDGSCHMWASSLDELHAFARRIGLKRGWFQNHDRLPHYDLTLKRREAAVKAGAIPTSLKEWLREMRAAEVRS